MFTLLLMFTMLFFQFDETGFAAAAVPIALAIIGLVAAWGFDLSKSRVATLFGLMATVYAAAAPYLNLMQSGKLRIGIIIVGVLCTALNRSLVTSGTLNKAATLIIVGALLISMSACGKDGPSRQELEMVASAGRAVYSVIETNPTLPEDLLAAKVINEDVYTKVKEVWHQAYVNTVSFNQAMARILAAVNPDYRTLLRETAPLVANIAANLQTVRSLIDNERVRQVLAGIQISFTVIAAYFAVQIGKARAAGYSDQQICDWVGLPYDSKRFELLAAGV